MSGDRKKLRRKLLLSLAREHRAETAGVGKQYRRSIKGWCWQQKIDLHALAVMQDRQRRESPA